MEPIGLYQLNSLVKKVFRDRFPDTFSLVAEIADIKENRSGHCYLELVEKRESDDAVIASARATIWAYTYRMLKPYFETTTGKRLQRGIKVLVSVEVVFHELYGYSLNVKNIDPTFTIGDLERRRKEILARLEQEGVIDMNRELPFPELPKTVAVISSPTAAGYGDFVDQLHRNTYGFAFHTCLFPAVMQGEKTAESVIGALERVYACGELFDVVVIIRGGGSQTDLGSFDSYELAANVAQFPLPVIAGIGHERDETIVDRVAYLSVKTPTAAAAFLIEAFQRQADRLAAARQLMADAVRRLVREARDVQSRHVVALRQGALSLVEERSNRLALLAKEMGHASRSFVNRQAGTLEQVRLRLGGRVPLLVERQRTRMAELARACGRQVRQRLGDDRHLLELASATATYADPRRALERGFSITRLNGKIVRDTAGLRSGDVLETMLMRGTVRSEVREVETGEK